MLRFLLLLVALVSGSRCSPAGDNVSTKQHRSNWPCPTDVQIYPCVCTTDGDYNIYVDCSEVIDEVQLATIFSTNFPFPDFKALTIAPTSGFFSSLVALPAGVFGEATFQHVIISGTPLSRVDEEAFVNSHNTLLTLDLSNNELKNFPFETVPLYIHLNSFLIANNYLGDEEGEFPDIVSASLRTISLAGNRGMTLTESTFSQVPLLETLNLEYMMLGSIPPNMFSQLNHIHTLDLGYNDFTGVLIENLINPPVNVLRTLHLHNNELSDIHPTAITNLDRTAKVNFRNNKIISLNKDNWKPILQDVIEDNSIDLRDNPLLCGCDVYWLVAGPQYMAKIHEDTYCASGIRLYELPLTWFQNHCPEGPTLWKFLLRNGNMQILLNNQ